MGLLEWFSRRLPPRVAGFIIPKLKFALASLLATAVDYGIFLALVKYTDLSEHQHWAQGISSTAGFVTNFFLQRFFVFDLRRKAHHAFFIAFGTWLAYLVLGMALVYLMNQDLWLHEHPLVTKILVTLPMFLFNFYFRRFAFEKRMIGHPGEYKDHKK